MMRINFLPGAIPALHVLNLYLFVYVFAPLRETSLDSSSLCALCVLLVKNNSILENQRPIDCSIGLFYIQLFRIRNYKISCARQPLISDTGF